MTLRLESGAACERLASARELRHGAADWLHGAAELAGGHKVAGVVASSAALAGGGAATVASVGGDDRPAAVRAAPGSVARGRRSTCAT